MIKNRLAALIELIAMGERKSEVARQVLSE